MTTIDPADLATLTDLAAEMTRWHDEDLASEQECMRCRDSVHTPSDLDPTPLCNLCAQFSAGSLPVLTSSIAALTAERNSMRAHVAAQDARIKGPEATIATGRESEVVKAITALRDEWSQHADREYLAEAFVDGLTSLLEQTGVLP